MLSINEINKIDKSEFLTLFGNIFENTEWIANKVFNFKPYISTEELLSKFTEVYENANDEEILKIFNSHPNLAVEKKLTKDSSNEQIGANLNQCSEEEFSEFLKLNEEYKNKFKFPFIIAVKGKDKSEILEIFKKRINDTNQKEFEEAKKQVKKIAVIRFNQIFNIS